VAGYYRGAVGAVLLRCGWFAAWLAVDGVGRAGRPVAEPLLRLFFDLDNTLIGDRGQLRPLVRESFEGLTADGHQIYIWSGVGVRWREVREHALERFVLDCFRKPLDLVEGAMDGLPSCEPSLVVDDLVPIVEEYGGVVVRPYYWENASDREMERVCRIVREVAATGRSGDSAYRAGRRPRPN
jgi:hypothetical protein